MSEQSAKTSEKSRFLYEHLRPHRRLIVVAVFGAVLAGALDGLSIGLLVPLLAALQHSGAGSEPAAIKLFSTVFQSFSIEPSLGVIITAVLIAILAKNLLLLLTFGAGFRLSSRVLAEVRREAAWLLLNVGVGFFDQSRQSDLVDVWYNKSRALENLIQTGLNIGANLLTALALFALLFVLSWQLTLMTIVLTLVGVLLLRLNSRRVRANGIQLVHSERRLLAEMHDSIIGIRLIRTSGGAKRVLRRLEQQIDDNAKTVARGNFLAQLMHPGTDVLGSLGIATLALLALHFLDMTPALALTVLLPFLYVLLRLVPLARLLTFQRAQITRLWANLDPMLALLSKDDKPFLTDGSLPFPGVHTEIRFDNVSLTYAGANEPALSQACFSIPAGKTTAIIGATGAGKSTVLHLLLRLYDPQQGRILLDGTPITDFSIASLHSRFGVVSQETVLFNDSIRANLAFTAHETPTEQAMADAARKAGIHDLIESLPQGYDTLVGDGGLRLSGGQRQRLAIARAFLRDPEILILDEATSALDNRTEAWIQQAMQTLAANKTVVVVAHRLTTIQNADHVIVLKNGHIVESGSLSSLREAPGEYARLAGDRA